MRVLSLTGVPAVLRKLEKVNRGYERGTGRGLKKAGLMIQRESQKIVPVQFGNLKNSAGTRNIGGQGFETDIIVVYTAGYAIYVHENLDAAHGVEYNAKHAARIAASKGTVKSGNFNRGEGQQAKFLEKPAREKKHDALQIIAAEVKRR